MLCNLTQQISDLQALSWCLVAKDVKILITQNKCGLLLCHGGGTNKKEK